MTIKMSNNTAKLLDCAITVYINQLTDLYCNEEDLIQKDRYEECIFELEAVAAEIGRYLDVSGE